MTANTDTTPIDSADGVRALIGAAPRMSAWVEID
jgi:hypothetical protein